MLVVVDDACLSSGKLSSRRPRSRRLEIFVISAGIRDDDEGEEGLRSFFVAEEGGEGLQ